MVEVKTGEITEVAKVIETTIKIEKVATKTRTDREMTVIETTTMEVTTVEMTTEKTMVTRIGTKIRMIVLPQDHHSVAHLVNL